MTDLADPEKLREHPTAAICGQNILFPPERMGCGQPIETCAEVYRCTECSVPFHKACADKHFDSSAENRQKTIASQAAEIAELTTWIENLHTVAFGPGVHKECPRLFLKNARGRASCASGQVADLRSKLAAAEAERDKWKSKAQGYERTLSQALNEGSGVYKP